MITLDGKTITKDSEPYVIAEIGNNHQGQLSICKDMFLAAKLAGADAVKLQKRCNKSLYTKTYYNRPYDNINSYGKTYGEHREFLEFHAEEYVALRDYAEQIGITFFVTPFDVPSINFLDNLKINKIFKIASADLTNTPLIDYIANLGKPMIMSTGGATWEDIDRAIKAIACRCEYALLHCIATYPNKAKDINLAVIEAMQIKYPNTIIGYSNHHPSVYMPLGASMMGAKIIEVHFTLNRANKGTDHAMSLEPKGLETLCSDLKSLHVAIGNPEKNPLPEEKEAILKMGKSIYPSRTIKAGESFDKTMLTIKSPGGGLPPYKIDDVTPRKALCDFSSASPLPKWKRV